MKNPYLYLEKPDYVETWVNGGKIPIKLASCYKSDKRNGIYTLDENIVSSINHPEAQSQMEYLHHFNSIVLPGLDTSFLYGDKFMQKMGNPKTIPIMRYEDGYILSFCTKKDKKIMEKLGKRVCVQINDIFKLQQFIDEQMNCVSEYQSCKYTAKYCRNHFLKSIEDKWQKECRMFWNIIKSSKYSSRAEEFWVDIPNNTAKLCKF